MRHIIKYLRKRKKNILSLLAIPGSECTPETFHNLRVEIKKISSFLSLLKFSADNFHKQRIEKPFRRVFKQAGKIREIHMEEEMLENYFSVDFLPEYRKQLKESKTEESEKYKKLIDHEYPEIKSIFLEIKLYISDVGKDKTKAFIKRRREKIKMILDFECLQPFQIHLLRKRLKQYNYSLKYTKERIPFLMDLNYLGDLTGKWHDGQVLLYHLESQSKSPGIQPNESEQIEKIRKERIIVNNLLYNEIKETIGRILQQRR